MKTTSYSNKRAPLRRIIRYSSLALLFVLGTFARADVPSLAVSVSNADGKVVFHGRLDSQATFATPPLARGDYVVQLRSTGSHLAKSEHYLLVASAGTKKVIADNVAGEMFAGPGVAMRVKVASRTQITGQVARGAAPEFQGNPNLKVINGRIYRWEPAETGSHLAGQWVDQTLAQSRQVVRMHASWLRKIQDHAGEGSLLNHYGAMGHAIGYVDNDD